MSSSINYEQINENFPVLGEDNDTQVFRDNFDTIKQSLSIAKGEIEELQTLSPRLDEGNDFNGNAIQNAVFEYCAEQRLAISEIIDSPYTVNYQSGNYQIFTLTQDALIVFENFPEDAYGKVTLELYSDGTDRTVSFEPSGTKVLKKSSNFPSTVVVNSSDIPDGNPVIIEVWQHGSQRIFLNYLGQFNS
jgi:hypothetical protein